MMDLETELGREGVLHRVWHDEALRALLEEDAGPSAAVLEDDL